MDYKEAIEKEETDAVRKQLRAAGKFPKEQLKHFVSYQERTLRYENHYRVLGERNSYSKTDPDATFMRMKDDHMQNGQLKAGYGSESNYQDLEDDFPEQTPLISYSTMLKEKSKKWRSDDKKVMNWDYHEADDYYIDSKGVRFSFNAYRKRIDDYGFERDFKEYKAERLDADLNEGKQALTPKGYLRKITINSSLEYYKAQQRALLSDPETNKIYAQRKIDVESTLGHLKAYLGFTQLSVRGTEKVKNELGFVLLAVNLRKITKSRKDKTDISFPIQKKMVLNITFAMLRTIFYLGLGLMSQTLPDCRQSLKRDEVYSLFFYNKDENEFKEEIMMMSKLSNEGRTQPTMITLDALVPPDHLVRKIDAALDFNFIYPIVESTYSTLGRPSVDPVVLVKLVFIQYLFGIRSMRQTIKEVETNFAYRWFLGYSIDEKIPHFSTFGKNYARRFRETPLFEDIFAYILEEAVKAGFMTEDQLYLDSTHIKANANKHRFDKEMTHQEARAYQDELENEINKQRIKEGKRPFIWEFESELMGKNCGDMKVERKISRSDPESGYYVKGEREKQFAYSAHTACDAHGFVVSVTVTPGNVHDSQAAFLLTKKTKRTFPNATKVIADAAYKTPKFVHFLNSMNLCSILPYTRPRGDRRLLPKKAFVYDEYHDGYLCPENQVLKFSTVNRNGYREYKSDKKKCAKCPLLEKCTRSKNHQKVITRHVWAAYMEEAAALRYTALHKDLYKKRKETIERVFADAKEKHGMRWTKYRGLEKVETHTMLTFAAMNLKKLATWLWKGGKPLFFYPKFRIKKTKSSSIVNLKRLCLQFEIECFFSRRRMIQLPFSIDNH